MSCATGLADGPGGRSVTQAVERYDLCSFTDPTKTGGTWLQHALPISVGPGRDVVFVAGLWVAYWPLGRDPHPATVRKTGLAQLLELRDRRAESQPGHTRGLEAHSTTVRPIAPHLRPKRWVAHGAGLEPAGGELLAYRAQPLTIRSEAPSVPPGQLAVAGRDAALLVICAQADRCGCR
jgi:hypothetical protein